MYVPKIIPSPNTWLWHPHVCEGVGVKGSATVVEGVKVEVTISLKVEVTISSEVPVVVIKVGTGVLSPHGVLDSAVTEQLVPIILS